MAADHDLQGCSCSSSAEAPHEQESHALVPEALKRFFSIQKFDGAEATLSETSKQQIRNNWQLQGIKLFKVRYYSNAKKCFELADD